MFLLFFIPCSFFFTLKIRFKIRVVICSIILLIFTCRLFLTFFFILIIFFFSFLLFFLSSLLFFFLSFLLVIFNINFSILSINKLVKTLIKWQHLTTITMQSYLKYAWREFEPCYPDQAVNASNASQEGILGREHTYRYKKVEYFQGAVRSWKKR